MKKFLAIATMLILWPAVAPAFTVNLSWTDNSDNEDGFVIEAAPSATGTFAQIGQVGANVTTFQSTGETVGRCYRVYAFNAVGASALTNVACAVPNGPTNLKLSALSSALQASWEHDGVNLTGFKITTVGTAPPRTLMDYPLKAARSYTIAGLQKGKSYCVSLVALNGSLQSDPSNQACADTLH